jgi:hypothetical protein
MLNSASCTWHSITLVVATVSFLNCFVPDNDDIVADDFSNEVMVLFSNFKFRAAVVIPLWWHWMGCTGGVPWALILAIISYRLGSLLTSIN